MARRNNHYNNNNNNNKQTGDRSFTGGKQANVDSSKLMSLASQVSIAQNVTNPIPYSSIYLGVPFNSSWVSPQLMVMGTILNPGRSISMQSPINVMGSNQYAMMRKFNTGYADNYEQSDVTMYEFAYISAAQMHEEFSRLTGILNMDRDPLNRFLPNDICQALGYDYDNLKDNFLQLQWELNRFAQTLNTYFVPQIPLAQDAVATVSKVWKDRESLTYQMYAFAPFYYYQWVETPDSPGLPYLKAIPAAYGNLYNGNPLWTIDSIRECISNITASLLSSTSLQFISSDLSKTSQTQIQIAAVDKDYKLVPEYSLDMLKKIHNARILEVPQARQNITQTISEGIIYNPQFVVTVDNYRKVGQSLEPLLDVTDKEWSNTDTASALEFSFSGALGNTADGLIYNSWGTQYIVGVKVFSRNAATGTFTDQVIPAYLGTSKTSTSLDATSKLLALSVFDWAPILPVLDVTDGPNPIYSIIGYSTEISSLNIIPNSTIDMMNASRIWAQFGLPQNILF